MVKIGALLPVGCSIVLLVMMVSALTVVSVVPADEVPAGIPLERAIKIGNGPHTVIEVSDPDCRFSRRMVNYWDGRQDVRRYVFLLPLKNHPDAAVKARFILAAKDRIKAYREVYSGSLDDDEDALERTYNDKGDLVIHVKVARQLGAVGTPFYWIGGTAIKGADIRRIEQLIGKSRGPAISVADPEGED